MKLRIIGCRGSISSPSQKRLDGTIFETSEFGGNTTSFLIETEGERNTIIDAGTGIYSLGLFLMGKGFAPSGEEKKGEGKADIYITHTHWDHIQGFPLFAPAYVKGNDIRIYGEAKITQDLEETIRRGGAGVMKIEGPGVEEVFRNQQEKRNFPAPLEWMAGVSGFNDFIPGNVISNGSDGPKIETESINHPGGCVSYKFTEKGKILVVSTDFEPDHSKKDERLKEWWAGADLLIADGQYETGSDRNPFIKGYGHSDPFLNVKYAEEVGVKKLVITHHDPKSDDAYLRDFERRVQGSAKTVEVTFAREGSSYEV